MFFSHANTYGSKWQAILLEEKNINLLNQQNIGGGGNSPALTPELSDKYKENSPSPVLRCISAHLSGRLKITDGLIPNTVFVTLL